MGWLVRIANEMILWHATTAFLAEEILDDHEILPSRELNSLKGPGYQGWGFNQKNQHYGEGVYLAKTAEDAIMYAAIRLRDSWQTTEDLDIDENSAYIGLFKVHIIDLSRLQPVNEEYRTHSFESTNEFQFLGAITDTPNPFAWFEKPIWVSRSRSLDRYKSSIEQLDRAFGENDPTEIQSDQETES